MKELSDGFQKLNQTLNKLDLMSHYELAIITLSEMFFFQ
jgi:hypothetical protein